MSWSAIYKNEKFLNGFLLFQVANVLGKFDSAQQMLNLNSIGVDYQPPTPAVREHIIGDDDDAHPASMMAKPFNPANALYGNVTRLSTIVEILKNFNPKFLLIKMQ